MKYFWILFFAISIFACDNKNVTATSKTAKMVANQKIDTSNLAIATFAGGCFWCTEAIFERTIGVKEVVSGYTAGQQAYPTYAEVGSGRTGHTEAIEIYYDSTIIDYPKLVEVFMATHDPTQLNRQGPDVGTQYRSGIYFRNAQEEKIVKDHIAALTTEGKYSKPIVTEVKPFEKFWIAEDYHQNYYEINPGNPYVQSVSRPKVEKFLKEFPHLVKEEYQVKQAK